MLLFDWVDERKTYAPMITSMMMHIAPIHNCVIAQVGPTQRGLIHYYGNIKTTKVYLENDGHSCDYLIYQGRWKPPGKTTRGSFVVVLHQRQRQRCD